MLFRRLGMLAAAFSIACIPMISQAADSVTPTVPGMTSTVIDAQTQADVLKDVPTNSWAYQAIVDLVNDGIIIGYPDGTFKGNRPLTRYEAAVLVERAVQFVLNRMGQLPKPQAAPKPEITQADIDKLRALLDEFKGDIDSLKLRVSDIDGRLKTVEATQARAKLGAVYFIRAGNFNEQVSAFSNAYNPVFGCPGAPAGSANAANCSNALAPNTLLKGGSLTPGSNVGTNSYYSGQNGAGYGYQLLRVLLDGNLDARFSYHLRLENRYYWDTPSVQLATSGTPGGSVNNTPNYLTSTTSVFDYPSNTTVRLNYAYMQYNDPSGLYAYIGRLNETDGTLGMLYADQFNGAKIGYARGPLKIEGGYAFDYPSYNANNTICPYTAGTTNNGAFNQANGCGSPTQTIFGQASFKLTKAATIGVAYLTDINALINNWNPNVCSFQPGTAKAGLPVNGRCLQYNSLTAPLIPASINGVSTGVTGAFTSQLTNLSEGSAFGSYQTAFAKIPVSLEAEGTLRFGNDPSTGTGWLSNGAYWFQGRLGQYSAKAFKPYLEGGFIGAGYNSISAHTSIINGTSYQGQYQANPNGYQISYVGAHYWFSNYGRVGVVYNWYDILNGTTLPVSSANYAGTFLTHDAGQGLFLQTYLQF